MNLLDYALRGMKDGAYYDEYGNLYLDEGELAGNDFFLPHHYIDSETAFISKEDCDRYKEYEIIMPDGFGYDGMARRPYFRMRGKPVTREQAFEIIRRTDMFFGMIEAVYRHDDYIDCLNFTNWLISKNHFPEGYGWIRTVGTNGITGKYPTLDEFVSELSALLRSFPFLDFVVALTDWNELPPEAWELLGEYSVGRQEAFERKEHDGKFYKAVVMGIHVRDKAIEFLMAKDAVSRYKEYAALYEKDRSVYLPDYYQNNGAVQVDAAYLRRCIESYGLEADAVFGGIPESMWKEADG